MNEWLTASERGAAWMGLMVCCYDDADVQRTRGRIWHRELEASVCSQHQRQVTPTTLSLQGHVLLSVLLLLGPANQCVWFVIIAQFTFFIYYRLVQISEGFGCDERASFIGEYLQLCM